MKCGFVHLWPHLAFFGVFGIMEKIKMQMKMKMQNSFYKVGDGIKLNNNLFSKKNDAIFYFFTYIVFPILSVYIGLCTVEDDASIAYWYLTILCNALCCFHDCVNRWDKDSPRKNFKVFIILILIIITYTVVEIFLILNGQLFRLDYILLLYCGSIVISIHDILMLFLSETILIGKNGGE